MKGKQRTANIVSALAGLTAKNSTFVNLLGICANVRLAFFKFPIIVTCRWKENTTGLSGVFAHCYGETLPYLIPIEFGGLVFGPLVAGAGTSLFGGATASKDDDHQYCN